MTADTRFLLIEDDDVDRERLRRLIAKRYPSATISGVESGASALAFLSKNNVDCVFVDYRLGDYLGTELVTAIRENTRCTAPIIMVSGRGDERIAVEAMRAGVYDYIPKEKLDEFLLKAAIEGSMRIAALQHSLNHANERLHRSMFDSLTGLANRDLFLDRLNQMIHLAKREGRKFAVLLMDLDGFKEVNDAFGHAAGDIVLAQTAKRLQELVRESDTVARFGGDEFGMILAGANSPMTIGVVAEKIVAAIAEPIVIDSTIVNIGVSIGLAICPSDGIESEVLVAHADAAMYRAKRSAKGYEFHGDLHATEAELLTRRIMSNLGNAVELNELYLEYQPKISLTDGSVCGAEALVRWQSGELGKLAPGQFIPVAERVAAIRPISYRILDLALKQMREWGDSGLNIPVAINLSARLLDDDVLVERFRELLEKYEIPPTQVTVELTETALAANPEHSRIMLRKLATLGVKISIDDFGAGFTSLRYLREFDIAEIKIDRMFVSNLSPGSKDEAIVRSVIALGQNFDVPVVAEGIEDEGHIKLLRDLGCTHGQGYRISYPLPASELPGWLQSRALSDLTDQRARCA